MKDAAWRNRAKRGTLMKVFQEQAEKAQEELEIPDPGPDMGQPLEAQEEPPEVLEQPADETKEPQPDETGAPEEDGPD